MPIHLDYVHSLLAKSSVMAKLAVKIRNQASCVVGYHLGETSDSNKNGEFKLLAQLAPCINTFVDVGANVGNWTDHLLHLRPDAKGFLFEPSLQCAGQLTSRFKSQNLVIRNAAVADQSGTAQFAELDNCGETSSLAVSNLDKNAKLREVSIVTLDEEFKNSDTRIDFLKIDTEGHDLKVLKGSRNLLSRIRFVQFEYNSYWVSVGSSLFEATRFMEQLGFSLFLVRSTGLHPFRYELWNDYFRYSNFFACRTSDLDQVRSLLRAPI